MADELFTPLSVIFKHILWCSRHLPLPKTATSISDLLFPDWIIFHETFSKLKSKFRERWRLSSGFIQNCRFWWKISPSVHITHFPPFSLIQVVRTSLPPSLRKETRFKHKLCARPEHKPHRSESSDTGGHTGVHSPASGSTKNQKKHPKEKKSSSHWI